MPHNHGAFRFVFGVQHGLWQKQALIKSKIKAKKKIRLREEKDICNCNNDRVLPKAELSIKNEIKRLLLHRAFGFVFVLNIGTKIELYRLRGDTALL